MGLAQSLDALGIELDPGLAKKLMGKQPAAHADLAMYAPDGQLNTLGIERLFPGKDVLVNAVYERAVEVKKEDRLDALAILHCR
jgi:hypothetical protein